MNPTFFHAASVFRQWLETNHATATELWVGYFKINSGQPSLTWPQSVDEALCFGWIDGLRKSIDAVSYKIRFTAAPRPNQPASITSKSSSTPRLEEADYETHPALEYSVHAAPALRPEILPPPA